MIYIVTRGGGASLYNPEQQDAPAMWQPLAQKYVAAQNSCTIVDIDGGKFRLKQA